MIFSTPWGLEISSRTFPPFLFNIHILQPSSLKTADPIPYQRYNFRLVRLCAYELSISQIRI